MKPRTKEEWIVILDLLRMIRESSAEKRKILRDVCRDALANRKRK